MNVASPPSRIIRFFAFIASILATAIVTWFVFVGGPIAWDILKDFASEVDWKIIFLLLFIFGYFLASPDIWKEEFTRLREVGFWFGLVLFPFILLRGLLLPIRATIVGAHDLLTFVIVGLLGSVIHNSAGKILIRAVGVLTLIWVSIFSILLFSNLWQTSENTCAWKFPRILTCLLTKHDGLAGGVVAAGGTIFAGWLAWMTVQEQIKQKEKNHSQSSRGLRGRRED